MRVPEPCSRITQQSHALRARYAQRSIALLYAAIVGFISTCLSIALDRALRAALSWLPVILAVARCARPTSIGERDQ